MNVSKSSCTLAAIGMCIAGFGIGVSIGLKELPEVIGVFVATVIAAFAGTGAAFIFQNKREDRLAKESDLKAGRNLENYLTIQQALLKHIKDGFLDGARDNSFRYMTYLGAPILMPDRLFVEVSDLAIFTSGKRSTLPNDIMAAEYNFQISVESFRDWSKLMNTVILPKMAAGFPAEEDWNEKVLLRALGGTTVGLLRRFETASYAGNDACLSAHRDLRIRVYKALSEMFPEHEFLNPNVKVN